MPSRGFVLAERIAPWFAGFLLALPIVLVRYPPMGDLAMHEAIVSIMRHLGDPAWAPPGLYFVIMPQANQLYPSLAYVLSYPFSTDTACKLVVAAAVFAVVPATARLLRRLALSPWLALLVGPVACGWTLRKGLVANMTGFALLLLALPSVERLVRKPSARRAAVCSLAIAVVFFGHESSAAILACILVLFATLRWSGLRRFAATTVPSLTFMVLAVVQWAIARRFVGEHMREIGSYFGVPVPDRIAVLVGAIYGGIGTIRLAIMAGISGAAVVASVLCARPRIGLPVRVLAWRNRYALAAILFLLLYLVFPMALGGTTLLAYRFLPTACACLAIGCSSRFRSVVVLALAAAAPVAMVGVEAREFGNAEATYDALDRIIALVPRNVAVAQLDLSPQVPTHVAPILSAANRVLAERGGRMLFGFTDTPPNPVYVPAAMQWNESVERLAPAQYAFLPAFDFERYSYLVAKNTVPSLWPVLVQALSPEGELVAAEGEWALFRSRLPTVPLTAPDAAPPQTTDTLHTRLARLLDAQRASH